MSYRYEKEKPKVFTEDGQVMFLAIRDRAKRLLKDAGAFTLGHVITAATCGDTYVMQACVDRLVELGELEEVSRPGAWAQFRVFVDPADRP